jgi:hypothetical protein
VVDNDNDVRAGLANTLLVRRRDRHRGLELRSILLCLLLSWVIVALPWRAPADDKPNLTITGKVIDHETRQPIKSFRVAPGVRRGPAYVDWDFAASVQATDGRYQIRCRRNEVTSYALRIEADGYQRVVSQDVLGNFGSTSIDFELAKQRDVDGTVRTPQGAPAAKARVAVVWDALSVTLFNGKTSDAASDTVLVVETDDFGRFHFRQRAANFCLVITHPTGYAIYQPAPNSKRQFINLDPWTRVEGSFLSGGRPISGVTILILGDQTHDVDFWGVTQTGADGRFVFDRALRGKGWVEAFGMQGMFGKTRVSLNSRCGIQAKFAPDKTVRIDFGQSGRPVVGKLQLPPQATDSPPWPSAHVYVRGRGTNFDTPSIVFDAKVDQEGAFRIDDVPTGSYMVDVAFDKRTETRLHLSQQFSVSIRDGKTEARPLDLGSLTLRN